MNIQELEKLMKGKNPLNINVNMTLEDFYEYSEQIATRTAKRILEEAGKDKNLINVSAEPEKLINVDEAAEFLDLTKPTIYTKVSRGELPYIKKGKRIYFQKSKLLEYYKQGSKEPIEAKVNEYFAKRGEVAI
jgi:excisionase family DNA binding protein